ncbi:ATP-binding cassette domain-containing protein [Betaproteobacteria bacterium]|nr:ATP-binding cassette domain-containing protein [Betaproteobacteria bacterium]
MEKNLKFTFEELIRRHKNYFLSAVFLSFFSALLPIAPIVYMRTIFGPVINSDSVNYLLWLTTLLIFVLSVNAIIDWIRDRIIFSGVISITSQIEERVFATTFETKVKNWSKGSDILSRLRVFRNFLTSNVATSVLDTPFSLLLLLAIFFIHPLMGVFSLLGALMAFTIGLLIEKYAQPLSEKAMGAQSNSRRLLTEYYRNSSTTMTMGNFDRAFDRWQSANKEFLGHHGRATTIQALGTSISKVVMMLQGSMILGVGTFLTLVGLMPSSMAGNLILAKFIGALAIRPTMQVVMGWSQVTNFREVYKELKVFLKDYKISDSAMELPKPTGELVVTRLEYNHETGRKILDDINFSVRPGNIVAVLGSSGAGKSTLCRLLVGIKTPTKGSINLDSVQINKWDKNSVGKHIGYLPQEQQLFEDDIALNIARYDQPDDEKLRKACSLFGIDHYYFAFKEGREIKISSDSSNLPGGLKQKISLARAFYGDPKLIVLDEPTSMLDSESKNLFVSAIKKAKDENATIIIATHDKNILKLADYVLAIYSGRQKFFDSKESLMKKLTKKP